MTSEDRETTGSEVAAFDRRTPTSPETENAIYGKNYKLNS
jgi:hypothetical protein